MKKKTVAFVLAMVLVFAVTVGVTVAYLTDKTDTIENTFTVGKVNITLAETFNTDTNNDNEADAWQAQLIPGKEYKKDPVVTVEPGSEKCYLFVKFEEKGNPDTYLTYTSTLTEANGWTKGDGADIPENVWYRVVDKNATNNAFHLLDNDTVTIKDNVTNENMEAASKAELAYTAYAIQADGFGDAAKAWAEVSK
ncbi:MAG: SipW-dependent-type signal peptide-containing protein [Oscillospiraceae bacterium]